MNTNKPSRTVFALAFLFGVLSLLPLVASADPNLPDLSPAAQQMIDQPSTAPLEQTFAHIHSSLQQSAWQLSLQVEFAQDPAAIQAAVELDKLLDRTGASLDTAQADLTAIAAYLDTYPDDDWQQRFGSTGFYARITQLSATPPFLRAMLNYHAAILARYHQQRFAASVLKQSREQLQTLLAQSPPAVKPQLALWRLRIAVLLAQYDQLYATYALQESNSLLRSHPLADLEFDVRFESLRAATAADNNFNDQAADMINWFQKNRRNLTNPAAADLQLAMFQAHHADDPSHAIALYRSLATRHPGLQPVVGRLLIGYHADTFAAAPEPIELVRAMADFELLALKQHYQNDTPRQYEHALTLCEAFLRVRPAANPNYPQFLYDAGLCRHQLSQASPAPAHIIAAIKHFHRFARKFPHHDLAPQAAATAAALAYDLFTTDPAEFTDLAIQTLATLVGRIEPGWTTPVGPFAHTTAAKQFRYYYGLTLQAAKQYTIAPAVFATVPPDSPHKAAADYHTVILRAQSHLDTEPPDANAALTLLENITTANDPLVLHLRTRAYIQLGRITDAVSLMNRRLPQLSRPDASLISLALNVLHRQLPSLLELHARADHRQLAEHLATSLPLTRTIYRKLPRSSSDEITARTTRTLLEILSLTAITIVDGRASGKLPPLAEILSQATGLIESHRLTERYPNSLWFTRARALLTFAAGDYAKSQQLFHRIRQATTRNAEDPTVRYYWWQARYFGLRCLALQGQPDQAAHIIDVLNHSHRPQTSPWQTRLNDLAGTIP